MSNEAVLSEIISKPTPLSEEQRKAVLSQSRYIRLVAGAGSGKTETLTRRILRLLLCNSVLPEQIVSFTFTEKAAQAIKDRIYQRVRLIAGPAKCDELGKMYVGTIHAYCFRLLQDKFGYATFDALDNNKEMAFVSHHRTELGLDSWDSFEEFIRTVNVVYDELLDRKQLEAQAADFAKQLTLYEKFLRELRLLTFGQMVALAVQELEKALDPISSVKHLLVDEYQDINHAQEKLVLLFAKAGASVFVVGDPRQSIYQWRGSDEQCFEQFARKLTPCEKLELHENRRSVAQIVSLANETAKMMSTRYMDLKPAKPAGMRPVLASASDAEAEANWIVSQIESLVEKRTCSYSDIAILLRSVSTSGGNFIDILRRRQIPYMVGGRVGLFRRDEAQALGRIFAWFDEKGFWRDNLYGGRMKTQGNALLQTGLEHWGILFQLTSPISRGIETALDNYKHSLDFDENLSLTKLFHDILVILRAPELLDLDKKNHVVIMANLARFNNLIHDYEFSIRRGGKAPSLRTTLEGLCWYMNIYARFAYEETTSDDIGASECVKVMTVHQAKGLEWPIVFVPALVEGRFPSAKTGLKKKWLIPRNLFNVDRYEGSEEDERRTFYVAITRAKDCLCLSHFHNHSKKHASPSRFLTDVERHTKKIGSANLTSVHISPSNDEDQLRTISVTEMIDHRRCGYFYRFRHVWGYNAPIAMLMGYGKSLHFALYDMASFIKQGESIQRAAELAIEKNFFLPFAPKKIMDENKLHAKQILCAFAAAFKSDLLRTKEMELRIEFLSGKAILAGKADLVLDNSGDSMEVREYKTAEGASTDEESSFQIQMYACGLSRQGKTVSKGSVAYIDKCKVHTVPVGERDLKSAESEAEATVSSILARNYPASPSRFCRKCDFRKLCKFARK